MSGDGYFRVEMSRKFCEDEMKEYSGLRPAIWPYWQYIENHWSDIQVSKRWRYTPFIASGVHFSRAVLRLTSLDLNWLFIKKKCEIMKSSAFADLFRWNYCLHNECWMFFYDYSLTAPDSIIAMHLVIKNNANISKWWITRIAWQQLSLKH